MVRNANNYEISSDAQGNHWIVPVARLANAAITGPVLAGDHAPTTLLSLLPGTQQIGTILSSEPVAAVASVVVDMHHNQIFKHWVRNVITYAGGGGAETAWAVINIGDSIYYDLSCVIHGLAGVYLSTSPLDHDGTANPLFGYAMFTYTETMPTTLATASTEPIAVQQV